MGLASSCVGLQSRASLIEVPRGREYDAVAGYFLETLGRADAEVRSLSRVVSRSARRPVVPKGAFTVMFHGCRTRSNEDSIIAQGFQVSRCFSGGPCFGTWFAYGAAYSDGGFVCVDESGERRIFICAVENDDVQLDNPTMRVVKQGRAYPVWLLQYWYPPSSCYRRPIRGSSPSGFHVVHGGAWVPEASVRRREHARHQQQGPLAARVAALRALASAALK